MHLLPKNRPDEISFPSYLAATFSSFDPKLFHMVPLVTQKIVYPEEVAESSWLMNTFFSKMDLRIS